MEKKLSMILESELLKMRKMGKGISLTTYELRALKEALNKMIKHLPSRIAKNLYEVLTMGFEEGDTAFINWELITNVRNKAITESEMKNLFERIAEAHRKGINFIVIIDEEHSNDTKKAQNIINAFAPISEIRVSATVKENKLSNFYEIPEKEEFCNKANEYLRDRNKTTRVVGVNKGCFEFRL